MTDLIATRPRYFRAPVVKDQQPLVERDGGDAGAGLIRNASIVTVGEALGHRQWLDEVFVKSVHLAVNKAGARGIKMRFTHPSLSGDGMASFLGRAKRSKFENGQSRVEIHFAASAHKTPDGDLANYVMDRAEEDPESFGVSIVFEPDYGAEDKFVANHEDENGQFTSPDPDNTKNYPHARLAKLRAADVVDEPAANPDGLFHRGQEIADEADRLAAFALGISDDKPEILHLGADADRIAAFASRFLQSHGLQITEKEKEMSETKKGDAPQAITQESLDATLAKFGEGLLAKVDEKLAANSSATNDDPTDPDELRKQGAKTAGQIMAFAASSGLNDHEKLAQEAIENGTSIESFKASLADRLVAQNSLTKDSGEQDADQYAAFRAEFRAGRQEFARHGIVDEDAYIRTRCRDEGLPVPAIEKAG